MNENAVMRVSALAAIAIGNEMLHLSGEKHVHGEKPEDSVSPAIAIEARYYTANNVASSFSTVLLDRERI